MENTLKLESLSFIVLHHIGKYLNQKQKITLSQVSTQLKTTIISQDYWQSYSISFGQNQQQSLFIKWLQFYSKDLKLKNIELFLSNDQSQLPNFMLKILPSIEYLQTLRIHLKCNDYSIQQQVLKMILSSTPNLTKLSTNIVLQSPQIYSKLPLLQKLQFTDDSVILQQKHILSIPYIKSLMIRCYRINFTSFSKYIQNNNCLQQLSLDCEQCQTILLDNIVNNLNNQSLNMLRLYHLENMSSQTLSNLSKLKKLNKLTLTKTFNVGNMGWSNLFQSSNFNHLQIVNFTQAYDLDDSSFQYLVDQSSQLKNVNLSWCNKITNSSINYLIKNCKNLEYLIVVGIKQLNDLGFESYSKLISFFNEKLYHEYRSSFKNKQNPIFELKKFFTEDVKQPQELKRLKSLDCQSVNYVSDNLLHIISLFRTTAEISNYYGTLMGVHDTETQRTCYYNQ